VPAKLSLVEQQSCKLPPACSIHAAGSKKMKRDREARPSRSAHNAEIEGSNPSRVTTTNQHRDGHAGDRRTANAAEEVRSDAKSAGSHNPPMFLDCFGIPANAVIGKATFAVAQPNPSGH
jgi:hypothetical protein